MWKLEKPIRYVLTIKRKHAVSKTRYLGRAKRYVEKKPPSPKTYTATRIPQISSKIRFAWINQPNGNETKKQYELYVRHIRFVLAIFHFEIIWRQNTVGQRRSDTLYSILFSQMSFYCPGNITFILPRMIYYDITAINNVYINIMIVSSDWGGGGCGNEKKNKTYYSDRVLHFPF